MKIAEAIASASELTGQAVSQTAALRWLSELDGQIIFDVYGMNVWNPYTTDDLQKTLVVPYPWDGVYVHHLEAMTYFSNAEYDRYENARVMCEHALGEFRRTVQRTKLCGRPTVQFGGRVDCSERIVPVTLTDGDGPSPVEIVFASPYRRVAKSYPGLVTWDSDNSVFLFPFTENEAEIFKPGVLTCRVGDVCVSLTASDAVSGVTI